MTNLILLIKITFIQTVHLLCLNETGITDDRYLENNLYGIIKEKGLVARECVAECMSHSECLSLGFEPSTGLCHLHMEDSNTALTDLVEKTGWKHSDVSQWPKICDLMGPCADLSCLPGKRCSMHPVTNEALCMEADVYVCSEESLPHATCSYKSMLTGGTRSCTCHSNYLDVPLDVLSVNNTCMKNGSWTTPTITCSGPYLKFNSPALKTYTFLPLPVGSFGKMTGRKSFIVYWVKTCRDAQITLHNRPDTNQTGAYQVVVGGYSNTISLIRQCIGCPFLIIHEESSLLSCQEYRPFWLSWKKDVISVGKGQVIGKQTFMKYAAENHTEFNDISVSSYVDNAALWLFKEQ
ncbi:uncharacterized protein [Haliotis asinina]|uniref:uncharacterized protein n=1 Tax=Haliotis asinina TaxID=109174 RepID=UPI0035322FFA